MELYQRMLALPDEIHILILEWYRLLYLNKEIKEKKAKILKHLQITLNKEIKNNSIDFIDIGDFTSFKHLLQNTEYQHNDNFAYLTKCIVGVLEYYYSLTYYEMLKLKKAMLLDNEKYVLVNYMNDTHLPLFLTNKNFEYLVDPDNFHSGATGFWSYTKSMTYMFGSYESKLDLWTKLINGHFCSF